MLSTRQPGADAQAKNSSISDLTQNHLFQEDVNELSKDFVETKEAPATTTKTTLFIPLPKKLNFGSAAPITRTTFSPDLEVKHDVTTTSSYTKIDYPLLKFIYAQGLKALERAHCTTFPIGYYDDKIGSLYDLNIAIRKFGNCWDESKSSFYRYAEYHFNRAKSTFKILEREYLNKAFTSIGKSKQGLEKFIYEPMNSLYNQKIEIHLDKQPERIKDLYQLAESIRLGTASPFLWAINPNLKIYLIESLLQDVKDSGHVELLNSGYIESILSDDTIFRMWVKIAPKTFDEYYQLALDIYYSSDSNLGSTQINTERYWIQSHSNISVAVFELTKWAADNGHKSAQDFLRHLQHEMFEMDKENICDDNVAENNISEDTTIQLKM